jgi:hypothetical protein
VGRCQNELRAGAVGAGRNWLAFPVTSVAFQALFLACTTAVRLFTRGPRMETVDLLLPPSVIAV